MIKMQINYEPPRGSGGREGWKEDWWEVYLHLG